MIKTLFILLVGIAVGAAAFWYVSEHGMLGGGGKRGSGGRTTSGSSVSDYLNLDDLKSELEKTGSVVREKARKTGARISDMAENTKLIAAIKAKFVRDPQLPSFQIGVDATDGVVTLSGKVDSVELVARAVRLAFEVEGVTKVYSTIQVSSDHK